MNNYMNMLLRVTLVFFILLVLTRLLGKKQLSELTFFNYIAGVTMGNIAGSIISESTGPYLEEFIGLIWWCILTGLVGYIALKWSTFRIIIDGEPTIIIKRGIIVKEALRVNRLNMDDVSMLLREKEIFSIKEVEYAILEPNGKMSIMKKPRKQPVTKSDMNVTVPLTKYLPAEIIADGKIIKKNLVEFDLDENWLFSQLKQQNVTSVKGVLYAELQENGSLYVQKK
ncbi:MAG: YetF domain-containing protein [Lachnotalea sp.]